MHSITKALAFAGFLYTLAALGQITSTRIGPHEWTCQDSSGNVISGHVRQDKAQESCTNEALANPGVEFQLWPTGYRIVATGESVVVSPPEDDPVVDDPVADEPPVDGFTPNRDLLLVELTFENMDTGSIGFASDGNRYPFDVGAGQWGEASDSGSGPIPRIVSSPAFSGNRAVQFQLSGGEFRSSINFRDGAAGRMSADWPGTHHCVGWAQYLPLDFPAQVEGWQVMAQFHSISVGEFRGVQTSPVWGLRTLPDGFYRVSQETPDRAHDISIRYGDDRGQYTAFTVDVVYGQNGRLEMRRNGEIVVDLQSHKTFDERDERLGYYSWGPYNSARRDSSRGADDQDIRVIMDDLRVAGGDCTWQDVDPRAYL